MYHRSGVLTTVLFTKDVLQCHSTSLIHAHRSILTPPVKYSIGWALATRTCEKNFLSTRITGAERRTKPCLGKITPAEITLLTIHFPHGSEMQPHQMFLELPA